MKVIGITFLVFTILLSGCVSNNKQGNEQGNEETNDLTNNTANQENDIIQSNETSDDSNAEKKGIMIFGGSRYDFGSEIIQTLDGGYIIVGYTGSFGNGDDDVWLIKTDANGREQWNRTFGGVKEDRGFSVQQTSDGGYILAGYTYSYGAGSYDIWVIKTNTIGEEQWNKTFGETSLDKANSIKNTNDGGYILTGITDGWSIDGYVFLLKIDSAGNSQWEKTYGGFHTYDYGVSVTQTQDNGYMIVGRHEKAPHSLNWYNWLVKTDANGNEVWNKSLSDESLYSICQTADGNYVISGCGGISLTKIAINGTELWTKSYGKISYECGKSVRETSDGGYIIIGNIMNDNEDICVIRTDASGDEIWNRTFGGPNYQYGQSVQQTTDGGYILLGYERDIWLIKIDKEGNTEWT